MAASPPHMLLQHTRQPVTVRTMMIFGAVGLFAGLLVGYVVMGTVHAVLETGVSRHYQEGLPSTPVQTALPDHLSTSPAFTATRDASATIDVTPRTSSKLHPEGGGQARWPISGHSVHTLFTSNGSPYCNFQTRIMVGTFRNAQKAPGGEALVAITRILHRTVEDELMAEVPTFRAIPLTPKCDGWCEFPVADRPNAVRQFFDAAQKDTGMIKAPWILMIETDFVWINPLPSVPAAESSAIGWGFPYGYIVPTYAGIKDVMRSMFPESKGDLKTVPNTGPSPILMRGADWLAVVGEWERLAAHIEATPEAKDKLGWVREMYAFSIACALKGVKLDLPLPPKSKLMAQPPADHRPGEAAMLHYTWGSIFKDTLDEKKEVWKFDKRFYTSPQYALQVPQLPLPPSYREGLTLQDGVAVTPDLVDILTMMIGKMNEASKDLPKLNPV